MADALVNVIWGSLYGMGFLIINSLPAFRPGTVGLLLLICGMVIWPLIIAFGVYRAAHALAKKKFTWAHLAISILFVASLLWNEEIGQVKNSFIYYLPLYTAFMDR